MTRVSSFRFSIAVAIMAGFAFVCIPEKCEAKRGPLYKHSVAAKSTRKLWRGIGNLAFGWAEIPQQIFKDAYNTDPFTGVFTGIYKGGKKGLKRTGIGAWEIVTFALPCNREYRPYIEPEFVLMDETD